MRKKITGFILSGSNLDYRKWLAEEAGALASRFDNLDNLSPMAILPLAAIAAEGGITTSRLTIACDMELDEIQYYLESLCDFGFAEENCGSFKATTLGEQLFMSIGRNMVIRERFEIKSRMEELNRAFNLLNNSADF